VTQHAAPLVSIVIPALNGERFIADAVASAQSQTYQPIETIVVDDGSTDATANVAYEAGANRVISLPTNCGVSTARNVGIAASRGSYVSFLDCDDIMLPDRIARQVTVVAAGGHLDCAIVRQRVDRLASAPQIEGGALGIDDGEPYPASTLLRREALEQIGGFDPAFVYAQDVDLVYRVKGMGGDVHMLDDIGLIRRLHDQNVTWQLDAMRKDWFRVVRATMRRPSPLVSVIIPVRDGSRYLVDALTSVQAQEMGSDIEVLVIDDGSSDSSADIARAVFPSAIVIGQAALGCGVARNHGVLRSRGRYLAFLDSDDLWEEGKLKRQLTFLDDNPEVDAVFGAISEFVSPEFDTNQVVRAPTRRVSSGRIPSSLLIRRAAYARVGPFAPDVGSAAEFVDWYARAADVGITMADIPDVVAQRRIHDRNSSARLLVSYPKTLKEIIDRRRQAENGLGGSSLGRTGDRGPSPTDIWRRPSPR